MISCGLRFQVHLRQRRTFTVAQRHEDAFVEFRFADNRPICAGPILTKHSSSASCLLYSVFKGEKLKDLWWKDVLGQS